MTLLLNNNVIIWNNFMSLGVKICGVGMRITADTSQSW